MLVKLLANNTSVSSSLLRDVEKEFAKSGIKLKFKKEKTDIPIVWDTTWGNPVYTRDDWYFQTIIPLAKAPAVILAIDKKDWKPKDSGGWHKNPYNGVYGMEIRVMTAKVKCGKSWNFYVICHEICHTLFQMERIQLGTSKIDETHNYLFVDNPKWQLKECLSHLDQQFLKSL